VATRDVRRASIERKTTGEVSHMALTIDNLTAASYTDVVNATRGKPANQWAENAFLNFLQKMGYFRDVDGGLQAEVTLDYKRNPDAQFLTDDSMPQSLSKTEVLTAVQYDWAEIGVPLNWTRGDEAKNPSKNQKVDFVKNLVTNGLTSHDELIEEALFATDTQGFHGLLALVPDSGEGSPGGIDASVEAFWRNPSATYLTNFTNIEARLTQIWNEVSKGTGSSTTPDLIVTDGETHAGIESTQQELQRWVDANEATIGFKALAFKTAKCIFSQFSTTRIYLTNKKSFEVLKVKGNFRDLGEKTSPAGQPTVFSRNIYSMLQAVVSNKSRLGVLTPTAP
jgi:hypothetical protein